MDPITLFLSLALLAIGAALTWLMGTPVIGSLFFVAGILVAAALKMANSWEKRAGSGCLNSFPRKISGVLPGLGS